MSTLLAPASVAELVDAVRSAPRVLAVGALTKPRLSQVTAQKITTTQLQGILEYEPSEFTFTALAGTRLRDITQALAAKGQYLPFDPMLINAGATLGGTLAAGLSGPGRSRFGGLKDFILGARFVNGAGRLLRLGGKVVKNAAGFDLPKFFVGSLGRFGVLADLTFKVFPASASTLSLKLPASDSVTAARILIDAAHSRWEPDALDILPGTYDVCLRLAGPAPALETIANEILARWPGEKLTPDGANELWTSMRDFLWAHPQGPLIKVPITTGTLPAIVSSIRSLQGGRIHISSGGNVAFVSLPDEKGVTGLLSPA
jgi:glycolate oxidase FAD binding subunit